MGYFFLKSQYSLEVIKLNIKVANTFPILKMVHLQEICEYLLPQIGINQKDIDINVK